ncbi:MAG: site-2 protease family protein [Thermomicrobiales bacterium]
MIARIHGVEVRLHPTFVLVFLWVLVDWRRFGLTSGPGAILFTLATVLLVFVCVLAHEFGHVYMARQQGVHVHDVSLSAVGGVARMDQMPENAPRTEMLIALAGPAANVALTAILLPLVLLAGVANGFSDVEDYARTVFQPSLAGLLTTLFYANLLLLISNILPAFPMDGGRVFRAALSGPLGRQTATRVAVGVGLALAALLLLASILVIKSAVLALIAVFIAIIALAEDRAVRLESSLKRMRVGQFALWDMGGISPEQTLGYALRGGPRDMVVTRGGRVVGMLWRNRLLAEIGVGGADRTVADVMEPGVTTLDVDASVYDVQRLMNDQGRWAVPVTEHGVYRGIFTGDRFLHIYRQISPDPVQRFRAFWDGGLLARFRS